MRIAIMVAVLLVCAEAQAQLVLETRPAGDFYRYRPRQPPDHILVIAHGMLKEGEGAAEVARRFIRRWVGYAEKHRLILIAPLFDTPRFGNREGGYGGYRNLFGRHLPADRFVNDLVDRYAGQTTSRSRQCYLYGHSAGGQFVNRYAVTHPDRVLKAVVSAAGRYSYPTPSAQWPYGAGRLDKTIQWQDGSRSTVSVSPSLAAYARAAGKVAIVVGADDTQPQPARPAHIGRTRVEIAQSWARAMNQNAGGHEVEGRVAVHLIPGIGHSSKRLTAHCARVLFGQ